MINGCPHDGIIFEVIDDDEMVKCMICGNKRPRQSSDVFWKTKYLPPVHNANFGCVGIKREEEKTIKK